MNNTKELFMGGNKMTANSVATETPRAWWEREPEKSESITARIEELKTARKHQAKTASELARAEYENLEAVNRCRDLTSGISQIIQLRLGYGECPEAVTIDGAIFVRTIAKSNREVTYAHMREHASTWEWRLVDAHVIDIAADS
jgi:hypothetical protein